MMMVNELKIQKINKYKNNYISDAKKEHRKQIRDRREKTQKELLSRVISKTYLRDLVKNSYNDLIHRVKFRVILLL